MRKVIVVAVREYQAAVKTKAFLISLFALPVIWGGMIVVQVVLHDKVDTRDKVFAILDHTGLIYDAIVDAARDRNEKDIFEDENPDGKQIKPRFLIHRAEAASDDPTRAALELSDKVRHEEILAFITIGPDAIGPREDPDRAAVKYHSNSPTYDDFTKWAAWPINNRIRQLRLEAAGFDRAVVDKAISWVPVQNLGLVSVDQEGNITKAEKTNELANIFVPMGLMMLMFMVIMVGAQPLMQSVLEEKMQRISEVLLGSVSPFQLMMGKLIGMVGVSLTIATLYLVGAFVGIHRAGYGEFFPAHVVWWFVLYQTLAVLMFGSLFVAVGAAVSDIKESQNLLMPIMIVVIAPLAVWIHVVKEPASTLATVMSLIPPMTPMLMVLRQAVPPGIPIWQPLLGVLLVLLTTLVCVFAAGRIFRVGILMQGKGAKLAEMARWAIRG